MKKIFLAGLILGSFTLAQATTINAPSGMIGSGALNGNYSYLWSVPLAAQNISYASITFTGVKETAGGNGNSISTDFGTFVGIGTVPTAGNYSAISDGDAAGDAFQGNINSGKATRLGTELFPALNVAHTWTYVFTTAQLVSLNSYIATGNWGFEIDPDCHFDVGGISFDYTVQTVTNKIDRVPESTETLGLLAIGMVSLLAVRRKLCLN
jgi:hypothetical protein